ncbi:DUF3040 domain-containing protein [Pseudonocardia parietis]|uniref:DUF3040 family protein n=1 Tax=Pseudonocardia parietis TaxID=570936 RepID=A0ABS4VZC0_9PSEU|nr:DUF3040 domain-containing protein [Pseudonocardia parietis]MBP2369068.1 hypothetical protein [Pseudonocardia parietis]
MPDDRNHRVLDDLERRLCADDPEFVARFHSEQERLPAAGRPSGARIAVVVAAVTGLLLLLLGSPAGALAAVAGTGVVWLAWRYPVRPQDPRGFPLT